MLTAISMFSPCAQWVFGPLSPVTRQRKVFDEKIRIHLMERNDPDANSISQVPRGPHTRNSQLQRNQAERRLGRFAVRPENITKTTNYIIFEPKKRRKHGKTEVVKTLRCWRVGRKNPLTPPDSLPLRHPLPQHIHHYQHHDSFNQRWFDSDKQYYYHKECHILDSSLRHHPMDPAPGDYHQTTHLYHSLWRTHCSEPQTKTHLHHTCSTI